MGTAFVTDREGAWRDILCVVEERVVGNDNTVAWIGRRLQLPESRLRPHFVRARVQVREYPDGEVAINLGPHRLAHYSREGELLFAPTAPSLAAGSAPSRRGLEPDQRGGEDCATASLDRASTRCPRNSAGRGGETGFRSNRETDWPQSCRVRLADRDAPASAPDHPLHKEADS